MVRVESCRRHPISTTYRSGSCRRHSWEQLDTREYVVTAWGAGLGVERVPLTYRIPDLMVFRAEALPPCPCANGRKRSLHLDRPRLIVECLSPSNRKGSIQELLADYARIAVPEVWLLDPQPPQFTSYRFRVRRAETVADKRNRPSDSPSPSQHSHRSCRAVGGFRRPGLITTPSPAAAPLH